MISTLAHRSRMLGGPSPAPSPSRFGIAAGTRLLVLPPLVIASVRLLEPGNPTVARILGLETIVIVAVQVWLSVAAVRRAPEDRIRRLLVPAFAAGAIVATGDILASWFAFGRPTLPGAVSVLAYDLVFGVLLAVPVVIVYRATSRCRAALDRSGIDASPRALIHEYERALTESAERATSWHLHAQLCHQLIRRHIRKTLEAVQRGYAKQAADHTLDEQEARDRRTVDDYLQSVPTVSKLVPIPTVATVFVLWKLVPAVLAVAAGAAEWFSGGRIGLEAISAPIAKMMPNEVASLVTKSLALAAALALLMLVLAPAIHKRDELLSEHEVCEREVVLLDDYLSYRVGRSSRRFEYVMAALPALPLALYGASVLAYAVAGLFVYPSPEGPLGGLVHRADLMHLGPVTGVVLSQAFLVAAAAWIAWIVVARRQTRVVLI